MSDTPRTDAVADFTAPEKLFLLARELERSYENVRTERANLQSENARLRDELSLANGTIDSRDRNIATLRDELAASHRAGELLAGANCAALEELAEAKREREKARDIHNSNMNRYAERAEQAEACALAAEKDSETLHIAVCQASSMLSNGELPYDANVILRQALVDVADAAIAGAKHG